MNRRLFAIAGLSLALVSADAAAQDASARTVHYHSQDIVPIHAKLKYTTLIELPATEKIMQAATGDKEFWVVDLVGNFCFVHPAKAGIASNLNLITDKGNIYSFTLQDVSGTAAVPDLKVLIQPADRSAIVAASGPPQFVPAAQFEESRQALAAVQSHVEQVVDEYKSAYVSISRASHEATLFTDDMTKLSPRLAADVSKTSALEINQGPPLFQGIGLG